MKFAGVSALPILAFAAGCAPYHYHAAALSPQALAVKLEARSLDDPQLQAWMGRAAGFEPASGPMAQWGLNELTLAAYYFNTQMDVARANAAAADARIQTAAMKPNPSVGADAGYETAAESPYLLGFNFSLPIETAGKRGYRIAEATHLSAASRMQVAETAWAVRSQVRAALADLISARQIAAELREQEKLQTQYVDLLDARFHAGEISQPDVAAARIDLTNFRLLLRGAEGQAAAARATLAAAVGVPVSGLAGKTLIWTGAEEPPPPTALPARKMRAEAVTNRLDVQRSLAAYEAAQSRLQLETARQFPDVDLGPGYAYEEGVHLISLRLATVLPLRNHNEGPIAEAEAQRKAAGMRLLAVQSAVIAQTDKALAQYRAAYAALDEAQHAKAQAEAQCETANAWLKSGEGDQISVLTAAIQVAIAERARLEALHQAQIALGSLEDALQLPIDPAGTPALPKIAPR